MATTHPVNAEAPAGVSTLWSAIAHPAYVGFQLLWVVALVARWRASDGHVRRQLAWVVGAAAISVAALVVGTAALGNSRPGADRHHPAPGHGGLGDRARPARRGVLRPDLDVADRPRVEGPPHRHRPCGSGSPRRDRRHAVAGRPGRPPRRRPVARDRRGRPAEGARRPARRSDRSGPPRPEPRGRRRRPQHRPPAGRPPLARGGQALRRPRRPGSARDRPPQRLGGDRPTTAGRPPRGPQRARAAGARADGTRAVERGDLRGAPPEHQDRRAGRQHDLHEARAAPDATSNRRVLAVLAFVRT